MEQYFTPDIKDEAKIKNSDCLQSSIACMKYSGVWLPDGLEYPRNFLYKLFALIAQTIFFIFIIFAEISYVFTVLGDKEKMVDGAVLMLSHIVQGVKGLTICLRQRRIKKLISYIDGPEFTTTDPSNQVILSRTIYAATIAGNVLIMAAAVTAVLWNIVPMLQTEISLPLKIVHPFDINNPTVFQAMYLYCAISVALLGVSDAAENYLVCGLVLVGAAQLECLDARLRSIGDDDDDSVTRDHYEVTVSCIKYHQNINSYVDELGSIFGFAVFIQFTFSSFVVCLTLFKITVTREPIERMTMVFYLICVFLELIMYCYPGNVLSTKSLLVSEAAYNSNWCVDLRSRRALVLTTTRAQRPLVLKAGGLFPLSLSTAASIVRTAYSYYAVLHNSNK